ncbi:MAG: sigma 54-interacting transcriptional regulator [Polyangiaceae bacterium]
MLDYLTELAETSPAVALAALRRRAEAAARAGDKERADALVRDAIALARGGEREEALAQATTGIVALFLSRYDEAREALEDASARFASLPLDDREEVARVDHNLGVVALYGGDANRAARAFERALAEKRRLGDRSGARACLLNLGLSLARLGELERADAALAEAERLARSLGQTQGLGWVLAARADVAVRAANPRRARDLVREAEAIADTLPGTIRADLGLLRAQIALLERDGPAARAAIDAIDAGARSGDPLVDARALTLASEAALATLPVDRITAARLAVRALRVARRAGLRDAEEGAAHALGAARSRRHARYDRPVIARASEEVLGPVWDALRAIAAGASGSAELVAAALARDAGAERAFLCAVEQGGSISGVWAADLDGLPISEARRRAPEALVALAVARDGPLLERDAKLGAKVAIAAPATVGAPRAVIVLEHRFVVTAFDGLTRGVLERWAIAAGLALRTLTPVPPAQTAADAPTSDRPPPEELVSTPNSRPHALAEIGKDIDLTTVLPTPGRHRVFGAISGKSHALRRALARLDIALGGDVPVLITGETGVGKELFARALHDHGARADRPFVAVNCGAIPDTLFEAELFGHVRGSFTGADRARTGLLARAEGGTFFLDEVAELPLPRQATLLRVLQERRYRPVGSDVDVPFDVRVVAATNRDLGALAAAGGFRRDLLYRLNTVEIVIPPLRERREDIPEIVDRFLARASQRSGLRVSLSSGALDALTHHDWPGNVRELEHLVDRLCLSGVKEIGLEHLPREFRRRRASPEPPRPTRGRRDESERDEVHRALTATGGNISRAAAHLGLTRHGLKKRMVRLGMREKRGEGAA